MPKCDFDIKLQSNFIEIALRHGCSSANLLYIFRTPFLRKTSVWLLLCFPYDCANTRLKDISSLQYSVQKHLFNGSLATLVVIKVHS